MQDNLKTLPLAARLLGYGGLIPFLLLSISVFFSIDLTVLWIESPTHALIHYGAVIISFLGAVHWGVALTSERSSTLHYIYGVTPALLAWSFLFLSAKLALIGMAVSVAAAYFVDRTLLFDRVQSGYQVLRLHLTVAVTLSLLVASVNA